MYSTTNSELGCNIMRKCQCRHNSKTLQLYLKYLLLLGTIVPHFSPIHMSWPNIHCGIIHILFNATNYYRNVVTFSLAHVCKSYVKCTFLAATPYGNPAMLLRTLRNPSLPFCWNLYHHYQIHHLCFLDNLGILCHLCLCLKRD